MAGDAPRDAEDDPRNTGDALQEADDALSGDDVALVVVAPVAENGVIGDAGGLPRPDPPDLAHCNRLTPRHPLHACRRPAVRAGGEARTASGPA